jgi:AcrR family transcriptional regulator
MDVDVKIPDEKLKVILYARERFFSEGFAKITVDEIVAELGMSKSTLYKNFLSKDALVEESVLSVVHEIMARVKLVLDSDSNAIEKFRGMIVILTRNIMRFTEKFIRDMQINARTYGKN